MEDREIHIELYDNTMYIEEDNSTGCEYVCKDKKDIIKAFEEYVNNYL